MVQEDFISNKFDAIPLKISIGNLLDDSINKFSKNCYLNVKKETIRLIEF
jgi:hypothetical protein